MASKSDISSEDVMAVRPERAAELLDVSRATIYNLMSRGELKSFMVGRSRRIAREEIQSYIDRHSGRVAS